MRRGDLLPGESTLQFLTYRARSGACSGRTLPIRARQKTVSLYDQPRQMGAGVVPVLGSFVSHGRATMESGGRSSGGIRWITWVAASAAGLGAGLVGIGISGSGRTSPDAPGASLDSAPSLSAEPPVLLLGDLDAGQAARGSITLRNPHAEAIEVVRVETSCPCTRVSPSTFQIDPGGSVPLGIEFDSLEEPEFRGTLLVEVTGQGATGGVLFRIKAKVTVRDTPKSRAGDDGGSGSRQSMSGDGWPLRGGTWERIPDMPRTRLGV